MCGGGDHGGCKYQAAFNAIQTQNHLEASSAVNRDAGKRFSGEMKHENRDQKRIRELEKTEKKEDELEDEEIND
ncbi:hypothetical protein L6452_39883 [Arctium lappa]|uniref:Uncharacterized protein n=1 Tax=Arctium lappa TaxID=4217 RepID=A0ACB8XTK0_ARCLA|nr:hypothetical protein L6452_39883 [Arctium lappa]